MDLNRMSLNHMSLNHMLLAGVAVLTLTGLPDLAGAKNPAVNAAAGGAMRPNRTIVENIGNSKEHTILVAAIKAADLAGTLSGPGPFTVFAPLDSAFRKLPPGTVDNLLKSENKSQLQAVLTYHVVPGDLTAKDLREKIKAGGGKVELKTVQGEPLTVTAKGRSLVVTDVKGSAGAVTTADAMQSNGVVHVVNTVLLP